MKILFVIAGNTSIGKSRLEAPHYPHIGIAYMTAILRRHGYEVSIIDMRLGYSINELDNCVKKYEPHIIGVSAWSLYYMNAYNMIGSLKEKFPNIPIIVGGTHVSAFKGKVLEESKADFALNGEGEYAFLEFCQAIQEGKPDFSEIDGLLWRKDGNIIENMPRKFITDLDALPFPDYEKFEMEKYIAVAELKLLPIITSRGCPHHCVFCGIKLSMGNMFRPRSAKSVVDELEYWNKKGFKVFDISDDTFTQDIERAKKICDLIIERKLNIQYRFINGIRADRLDYELAKKLKDSGCIYVSFGVETGNEEIMKKIKKGVSFIKVKEAVNIANKTGWVNQTNFIIGHPDETFEKAMDTIKLAKSIPSTFVSFANAIPYPGTELYDWITKNGRFLYPPEFYLNNIEYSDARPIFETKQFTVKEREKTLRMGFLLSRKRFVHLIVGKFAGNLIYPFIKSDKVWAKLIEIFLGNKLGYKFFRLHYIKEKIKVRNR